MWTISEVKERGKRAFKANYWYCVLAAFLMSLFAGSRVAASNSQPQSSDLQNQFSSMPPEQQRAVAAALIFTGVWLVVNARQNTQERET